MCTGLNTMVFIKGIWVSECFINEEKVSRSLASVLCFANSMWGFVVTPVSSSDLLCIKICYIASRAWTDCIDSRSNFFCVNYITSTHCAFDKAFKRKQIEHWNRPGACSQAVLSKADLFTRSTLYTTWSTTLASSPERLVACSLFQFHFLGK